MKILYEKVIPGECKIFFINEIKKCSVSEFNIIIPLCTMTLYSAADGTLTFLQTSSEVTVVPVVYATMRSFPKRLSAAETKRLNYMCVYVFAEIIEKLEVHSILNGHDQL